MYQGKTFLAIIPARSGSKRLPNKNIKDFCGKPLIAWSIEAGLQSPYIDQIILSTDSQSYIDLAHAYGIQSIKRPLELASDQASSFQVIQHVLKTYHHFDYIVMLQPTSPLRQSFHINEAIVTLIQKSYKSLVSVSPCEHSPLWCNTLPLDLSMSNFIHPSAMNKRSQDLPTFYRLNGAIFISERETYLKHKNFISQETYAYIMEQKYSIDIDTQLDFFVAETYYRYIHEIK